LTATVDRAPDLVGLRRVYHRWIDEKGVGGSAPAVNANRRPGEWQSFQIWFRAPRFDAAGKKTENARFIRVLHNGVPVQKDVEVDGPTRAQHEYSRSPAESADVAGRPRAGGVPQHLRPPLRPIIER